jgi:hypothetical protein
MRVMKTTNGSGRAASGPRMPASSPWRCVTFELVTLVAVLLLFIALAHALHA